TGVSERSIKSARVVLEHGTPELQDAVTSGRLAVHDAEKAARQSPEAQADLLAAVASGRNFLSWQNNYGRNQRATKLAATTCAMPTGRFPIILIDPPWPFEVYGLDAQTSHPTHHYPTMTLDEIRALPVAQLATDDCVLFLWTTAPLLDEGTAVAKAWGFQYTTGLVWDKEVTGLGYWVRNQHEHLLLCKRGKPPVPAAEIKQSSMIWERRRDHTPNPEKSYAIIEPRNPNL